MNQLFSGPGQKKRAKLHEPSHHQRPGGETSVELCFRMHWGSRPVLCQEFSKEDPPLLRLNTDAPDIGADEPAERIKFGSGQTRPQPSHQRAAAVTTVPKQLGKGLTQAMRRASRAQTECTIRRTKSELSYSVQHTNSQNCFMVCANDADEP